MVQGRDEASEAHDEAFMREALEEAEQARDIDEIPVGAVLVRAGQVIARAHNGRETQADPTAHAEILTLRQGAALLRDWRLEGCTLYVTLEPCFMCAGAIVNARIERLVFGAFDPKAGAVGSLANVCADARLNHRPQVRGGVLAEPCGRILRAFFASKRRGGP